MTIVLPDPLPGVAEYHRELAKLEQQILAAEQHLSQLRRERGCRIQQLAELQQQETAL
jgi:chromosome segregation ATPase